MPIRNFGAGTPRLNEGIIVSGSDSASTEGVGARSTRHRPSVFRPQPGT